MKKLKDCSKCAQCPRKCAVDRKTNTGYCGANNYCKIAKVMLHYWEEPIISGDEKATKRGSGAIFFSHCNLKCVYCQNFGISQGNIGQNVSCSRLAEIFRELELSGAVNINLVTPTHYVDNIIEALNIYRPNLPIVWNTSGYESVEVIERLAGYVDIFLTDLKYYSTELAKKYSSAGDYFEYASKAIIKMREVQPEDIIENGLMKKGLIIRHMVLPTHYRDSIAVLEWIAQTLGTSTYVSLMSQYVPFGQANLFEELSHPCKKIEYHKVCDKLIALGFFNGYTQECMKDSAKYIPDFLKNESIACKKI